MNPRRLTPLEYAILGLVRLYPMSGYDVHRLFVKTPLMHFSSSPGAIYPALNRLSRRGLLSHRVETPTELRPKRVYSLSPEGAAALDAWLRLQVTPDELIRDGRSPLLRFSLADGHLSAAETQLYLATFGQVVLAYLQELYRHRDELSTHGTLHQRLALENGIRGYEALAGWIRDAAVAIEATPVG